MHIQDLKAPGLDVSYTERFITDPVAQQTLEALLTRPELTQGSVRIFGRQVPEPRLTAWFGDAPYTYSGKTMNPHPLPPILKSIRQAVENITDEEFNSVLLNVYRSGQDSVSWHADDEPELGPEPFIASISLGGTRTLKFRPKTGGKALHSVSMKHGSLLVMRGPTQANWQHSIAKTTRVAKPRVNLTFRLVG